MASPTITKRRRIGSHEGIGAKAASSVCTSLIGLLDDPVLREIITLLPDPESVCAFGACCTRLRELVKGETSIWNNFLGQIPVTASPQIFGPAKDIVLRFASARLFASRVERLLPHHQAGLGQENNCPGCAVFPGANFCWADLDRLASEGRGDAFFLRYSVRGSLLWQGFLPSRLSQYGDIHLHYDYYEDDEELDFSDFFDWPEMKAYLAYPPPTRDRYGDPDFLSREWRNEKFKMERALYKSLTLTIVIVADDITDRRIGICTHGTDGERFMTRHVPRMKRMSVGSRRDSPDSFVEVKHDFDNNYGYETTGDLPQKYIGPVLRRR